MSAIRHVKPSKQELEFKYNEQGATLSSLAKVYSTTHPTIRAWLNSYGISIKKYSQICKEKNCEKIPTKEQLEQDYVYNSMSLVNLQRKYSAGQETIYEWLATYSIQLRDLSDSCKLAKVKSFEHLNYDRETVMYALVDVNYDRELAAENLGVSRSHMRNLIIRNNISVPQNISYKSKAEIELLEFCSCIRPDCTWISGDRSIIAPLELDIYSPELKLAIEYCGIYWHSECSGKRDKNYHQNKWKLCKDFGIDLITVFESDDLDKVKILIQKKIGLNNKRVWARKCEVVELNSREAKAFHDKYHLHKSVNASVSYGLKYGDEVLIVLSMSKSRFSKKYEWECARVSSACTVVGGVSKLFKHFIKSHNPSSIVTFSDLRFGDGHTYLNAGFVLDKALPPNYWYHLSNSTNLKSRITFQKHKLKDILPIYDHEKSEFQNMTMNGYDRIWDCGNARYVWATK